MESTLVNWIRCYLNKMCECVCLFLCVCVWVYGCVCVCVCASDFSFWFCFFCSVCLRCCHWLLYKWFFFPLYSSGPSVCSWYLKILILSLCKARMTLAKVAKPFFVESIFTLCLYKKMDGSYVYISTGICLILLWRVTAHLHYGCLLTFLY